MGEEKLVTVDAIICPKCSDTVWSRHRHDMRFCSCEYCFIDGGRSYTRVGYGHPGTTDNEVPRVIKLELKPT